MMQAMVQATRKNVTLERILAAALVEFSESGFDAARLESVARRAKVTKQLVHHYFQTKETLYGVVFDTMTKTLAPLLDHSAYEKLSPADAVRRLVNLVVELHLENPGMATLTLDQGLHRAAQINPRSGFVPLTRAFIQEVVAPILDRGARSGEFRDNLDPTLFYATIFHLASGCFLMGPAMTRTIGLDFDSPEGIDTWRNHVIDFSLAALRPQGIALTPGT